MVTQPESNKTELLRKIKEEIINDESLPLYKERKRNRVFPVIGEGNHNAEIMFIGEAPGKNEAEQGRPFCGASGKILDELLGHIKIPRSEVYITNIVKDRPPLNRDPLPDEILSYSPFLDRQINIIKPKIIATLGRFSMKYIMEKFGLGIALEPISRVHGKVFKAENNGDEIMIIPLYHPAVAVYDVKMKGALKNDFEIIAKLR